MPQGTQVIHGVEYVYEYDSKRIAEKNYNTHKRHYIGKMVDGVFVPNKNHQLQQALERATSISPGPVSSVLHTRNFYGATYLFDAIGEKLGITADLCVCFPDLWKQILSIAYFLILEDKNSISRFPRWAANHMHPYGNSIPSQRSSELFACIDEDTRRRFFLKQANRRLETEYLAYDITSISSYSRMLSQVRYGRNKDHDPLPQINLAMLYGDVSRLPVYYRTLPGNIADVTTIRTLLTDIDLLKLDKVKLVLDRGFYSEENINALYHHHYKFLIAAPKHLRLIQDVLDDVRMSMRTRACYSSRYRINTYSRTIEWLYHHRKPRSGALDEGSRRLYLHLFFNDQRAVDDKAAFNTLLDTLEAELYSGKLDLEHEKLYRKYFEYAATPVRGMQVTPIQSSIDEAEKNYGYFALISNDIRDPLEALRIYRSKDLIEKAFGNLKERLNLRRTSVSSEENLEGKLFVQFIALMYLSYIDKMMDEQNLYKDYTLHELLDELDVIECFGHPSRRLQIGEITKKQVELFKKLDVPVPLGV